jgi:hypothetical protein
MRLGVQETLSLCQLTQQICNRAKIAFWRCFDARDDS